MSEPFAAYVRTSTEDNQSPEDSRRWQLALAEQLIGPHGGSIVRVYHDIDVSRSLPWPRRKEAARLLQDAADQDRPWHRLVIGEPQRAFSGPQFQLVLPVLSHFGIELWVPELGGPVDPDSEAHDLVMSLFGGLSKAERRRVQHRTRASMLALAAAGRWLGGRPNYGYRVVDTDSPHPNKRKAAMGVRLRRLEPDPITAPIVQRIFELFDQGVGYRSIAVRLESEGLPSPGEIGPTKHPRSAGVWSGSTVRTILMNPRYLGHQVAGRQRRYDELMSTEDPALGTISRQRWQGKEAWSWSEEESWPALVSDALYGRVNGRIKQARGTTGSRRPRTNPGKYVLAGAVRCGLCGKSMHGSTMKGKPYYRCEATRPDYARPSVPGHPPTYAVREERVLAALDGWLQEITQPKRLEETIAVILAGESAAAETPAEVLRAQRDLARLDEELNRLFAAIRAGMDPELAAGASKQIQTEMNTARDAVRHWELSGHHSSPVDAEEIRAALTDSRSVVGLLRRAERSERSAVYSALGVSVEYVREAATGREYIRARSQLRRGGGRI